MYKIGEIADLAGVSRRTIDYYTKLGLLKPLRSESNYRYYSEDTLIRLKLIEGLKEKRLILEEIKEHFRLLDNVLIQNKSSCENHPVDLGTLQGQVKQLENQLAQLQPAAAGLEPKQAALLTKQILIQSTTLIQSLLLYIHQFYPEIEPFL